MDNSQLLTLVIFTLTYLGIIFTRLPGVNVDRPSAAFSGAVALVVFGILTPAEAIAFVDMNTIFLLLGMMIIIATLQLDGFFTILARQTVDWSRTRSRLLVLITLVTGISSAFLVNDAVVLMFTPVIIQICRSLRLNPIPYLLAEILASNIGSVMTITGNPQNMLVGLSSGIAYGTFLLLLLPVSALGMALVVGIIRLLYKKEFQVKEPLRLPPHEPIQTSKILRSGIIFLLVVVGFFIGKHIGLSIPLVAITGAALILLFGEVKPSDVIRKVDWVLLLFFGALFIVVGAVEKTGLLKPLLEGNLLRADANGVGFVHGLSLLLSQVVSNVPFVVLMLPMLKAAASPLLWLSLASASTLAGNATIIGAMANLIVIESASKEGVKIGFWEFLKAGLLVTLLSLPLSMGILLAENALGWL
jgi:Na+/H+ antiporter NhaD/arsenite permease-like protein